MKKVISAFLMTILEISCLWSLNLSVRAYKRFRDYCRKNKTKPKGVGYLVLSIIGSILVALCNPIFWSYHLLTNDNRVYHYMIILGFIFVFTAVFMNITVVLTNYHNNFKVAIGDNKILQEMNICDEWCLAVGFLCSGGWATIYCN